MVIGRLEEETASSREESERAAEARVRRIRDKYEAELREVERSERQTLEKFNNMKVRLRQSTQSCIQFIRARRVEIPPPFSTHPPPPFRARLLNWREK